MKKLILAMFLLLLVSCHCETSEERRGRWSSGVVYYNVTVTKGTEQVTYKAKNYYSGLWNPGFEVTLIDGKKIVVMGNAVFEPVYGRRRVVNGMLEYVTDSEEKGKYKF